MYRDYSTAVNRKRRKGLDHSEKIRCPCDVCSLGGKSGDLFVVFTFALYSIDSYLILSNMLQNYLRKWIAYCTSMVAFCNEAVALSVVVFLSCACIDGSLIRTDQDIHRAD